MNAVIKCCLYRIVSFIILYWELWTWSQRVWTCSFPNDFLKCVPIHITYRYDVYIYFSGQRNFQELRPTSWFNPTHVFFNAKVRSTWPKVYTIFISHLSVGQTRQSLSQRKNSRNFLFLFHSRLMIAKRTQKSCSLQPGRG